MMNKGPKGLLAVFVVTSFGYVVMVNADSCGSPYKGECRAEDNLEEFKPGCCRPCPSCIKGRGKPVNVTAEERCKRSCVNCIRGETYNDKSRSYDCKPCQTCDPNREIVANCTRFSNTKCGQCKPGFYSIPGHPACFPCVRSRRVIKPDECRDFFERQDRIVAITTIGLRITTAENVTVWATTPATITSVTSPKVMFQALGLYGDQVFESQRQIVTAVTVVTLLLVLGCIIAIVYLVRKWCHENTENIRRGGEEITVDRGEYSVVYKKVSQTDVNQVGESADSGLGGGSLSSSAAAAVDGNTSHRDAGDSDNSSPTQHDNRQEEHDDKVSDSTYRKEPEELASSSDWECAKMEEIHESPRYVSGMKSVEINADPWASDEYSANQGSGNGEIRTPVQETEETTANKQQIHAQEDGKSPDDRRPTQNNEPHS